MDVTSHTFSIFYCCDAT